MHLTLPRGATNEIGGQDAQNSGNSGVSAFFSEQTAQAAASPAESPGAHRAEWLAMKLCPAYRLKSSTGDPDFPSPLSGLFEKH